jgi:uncharacterized protein YecT (DUF1311 family)
MSKVPKSSSATQAPPRFPALTAAQKAWVAARRTELKAAIDEGIESGAKDGYVAFDVQRILGLIEQRRSKVRAKRA